MRTPTAACAEMVATLRAAGFDRVAVDPEQLVTDPTCVWVQPRSIVDPRLDGGGTLVVWLYLIAANTDTATAMALLDDALAGVLEVVDVSDTDDTIDLTAAVLMPGGSAPLPAYRVAVDLDL